MNLIRLVWYLWAFKVPIYTCISPTRGIHISVLSQFLIRLFNQIWSLGEGEVGAASVEDISLTSSPSAL